MLPVNPRLQKLASDWKTYVALVAAAATAMSAFTDLVSKAADTVSGLKNLSPQARWLVAAVFLVLTIVFLLAALSRRSLLLEPKRFLLSSENPEHLVGREEEVAHLARQCSRHSMVFLTGDSGTGKSALVRAGLAHGLLAQDSTLVGNDFVPLVVDLSGVGWHKGLSLSLARGLSRLPDGAWQALGGGDRPAAESVVRWLRTRPSHAPRRLLVVLDQFDDYLAVHRSQFYEGTTLRRPEEIEKLSADWHGLAELLRSGSVTVLVVARSEAAGSFPALSFVESAAIAHEQLTRLPGNLVAPLLNRLGEPVEDHPVISDPEFGWLQLQARLLRDLQASGEGQILPIQLSVALNSLRLSRYLTPAEYERQGGLRGLERLHVENHAKKAAEASRVPPTAILEALLTMVSPDSSKTRLVSRADFESVLGRHGATPEAAARAILQLEDDRLLRRVLADGTEAETLLLYHDYLARAVREAYRQANQWTELLRERSQLFQEAVSWRQRWRALLTPTEQTRLLWERFRGRFSFDERLRFFGLSTAKWLPLVVALLLVGTGGWEVDRYRRDQIAAQVMEAIGHPDPRGKNSVTEEEAGKLIRLSTEGRGAVIHALHLAIRDEATARRASRRVDYLVALAIGLDPRGERSRVLIEEIVEPTIEDAQAHSESAVLAAAIASKLRLPPSAARLIARSITARMKTESDSSTLASLGNSLASLSAKLERHDIAPGAAALVARMKTETDSSSLGSLSEALVLLSGKLEKQDVAPLAAALVARMKTETHISSLALLGSALGSLSGKLEKQDVATGVAALVARTKTETDSDSLAFLGEALGSLSDKLKRQDVAPLAVALVARMKTETDSSSLGSLSEALVSLSGKLESQDVAPLAAALVARMKTETDRSSLALLGEALDSLSGKLEKQDIAPLAAALVARMKTETDSSSLGLLGIALGSLSGKIERQDVATLTKVLVVRMKTETNSFSLALLGRALSSFSGKIERQDVAPGVAALVARMGTETDISSLGLLGMALGSLSGKIERQDVAPGVAALVARMKTETDSSSLALLGRALSSLSGKLESQDVAPLAETLVARMKTQTDSNSLVSLGKALGSLRGKLNNQSSVTPAFEALATRAGREWDVDSLTSLTQGLGALGPALPNPVSLSVYPHPVRVEQVYVDLLKSPFIVGKARANLLKGLEQATGQTFSGDLWSFVDWATQTDAGRALRLDLEGPPPWLDGGPE